APAGAAARITGVLDGSALAEQLREPQLESWELALRVRRRDHVHVELAAALPEVEEVAVDHDALVDDRQPEDGDTVGDVRELQPGRLQDRHLDAGERLREVIAEAGGHLRLEEAHEASLRLPGRRVDLDVRVD